MDSTARLSGLCAWVGAALCVLGPLSASAQQLGNAVNTAKAVVTKAAPVAAKAAPVVSKASPKAGQVVQTLAGKAGAPAQSQPQAQPQPQPQAQPQQSPSLQTQAVGALRNVVGGGAASPQPVAQPTAPVRRPPPGAPPG